MVIAVVLGMLVGVQGVVPSSALAQGEPADETAARRAFRLGQAHYEAGEFGTAGRYFEEAYELSGRAPLLFNAYVAYRDGQDIRNAARMLRQYLDENGSIPPMERDQLEARLRAMEATVAQMGPAPTETTTDEPDTTTTTTDEPDTTTTTTDEPDTTTTTTTTTTTPRATEESGGFNPSPVGFIVAGAGAALLVGGVITGVMANGEESTLRNGCDGTVCPDDPALRDAASRGKTLALTTDILLITGGVAVATGAVLLFVLQNDDGDEPRVQAGAMCNGTGCYGSLATRF